MEIVDGYLAHQRNQIGKVRNANSTCLTTFLSAMLIGLNVISGSCISKLIGQKFTSFLRCHFLPLPLFSLRLKTCLSPSSLSLSLASFCLSLSPSSLSLSPASFCLSLSPASYLCYPPPLSPFSLFLSPASFCLSLSPWFSIALRPRKPEGSLGRTVQDGHLDSHTASELCEHSFVAVRLIPELGSRSKSSPN